MLSTSKSRGTVAEGGLSPELVAQNEPIFKIQEVDPSHQSSPLQFNIRRNRDVRRYSAAEV